MSTERLSTSDIANAPERPPQPSPDRPVADERRAPDGPPATEVPRAVDERPTALFTTDEAAAYRERWSRIQTGFVDEPRDAVGEADALVAEVMKRLAEVFADRRGDLESQWERTERVSTEDLRQAMRHYRSFFERLLAV
jgi:hypothetical protein